MVYSLVIQSVLLGYHWASGYSEKITRFFLDSKKYQNIIPLYKYFASARDLLKPRIMNFHLNQNHSGSGNNQINTVIQNTEKFKKNSSGVPRWLKIIGAIVAIVIPIWGVYWGIHIYKNNKPTEIMNINQNHSGSGDNIINLAPPQRHLNSQTEHQITSQLPAGSKVTVFSYTGDTEGLSFATEITRYLELQGYSVGSGQGSFSPVVYGLQIRPGFNFMKQGDPGYMLIVGYNNQNQ